MHVVSETTIYDNIYIYMLLVNGMLPVGPDTRLCSTRKNLQQLQRLFPDEGSSVQRAHVLCVSTWQGVFHFCCSSTQDAKKTFLAVPWQGV